ncbi:MAG: PQQ-dependent sugar dehydrogenase [Planctomycetes bacterium]|nr:PQQ-dependent sugar dehydrogenase [Planctomycetota bacterium]
MRFAVLAAVLTVCPILAAQSVAGGFASAVVVNPVSGGRSFAFAPDGRLFYTENASGQIMVVDNPTTTPSAPSVFATVSGFVAPSGNDLGLHGIVLHPNFPTSPTDSTNRFIYVIQSTGTTGAPQLMVKRFLEDTSALGTAASGSETTLISGVDMGSAGNNFGGRIVFDAAANMFVSVGDGGASISLAGGFAQDVNDRRGKVLRYQADGTIPLSNPFTSNAMWARGLHNPRGMAINPTTGDLFGVDTGNSSTSGLDELNVIISNANYGWDTNGLSGTQGVTGYSDPAWELGATFEPSCAAFHPGALGSWPTVGYRGGVVYLGSEAATGSILRVVLTGGNERAGVAQTAFAGSFSAPVRDMHFGPDGNLYVLTDTVLYRITYTGNTSTANPVANAGVDQTVNEGATVTLNGSASSDADVSDVLRYTWKQVGGSTVVSITNPTLQIASFVAPQVTFSQNFTFELIVEDGNGGVSDDFIVITVNNTGNPDDDGPTDYNPPGEGGCSTSGVSTWWWLLVASALPLLVAVRTRRSS